MGDSLAAANTGGDVLGDFIKKNDSWAGVSVQGSAFRPDMSAGNADDLLADLGLGSVTSYGGGTQYADGSSVLSGGVMTDAGSGEDSLYDQNVDRMLGLARRSESASSWRSGPVNADGIPTAEVRGTSTSLESPTSPGNAGGYINSDGEAWATPITVAVVSRSFQEVNDQRVVAGTYDRFSEIGNAWADGRYGDAWGHLNFTASAQGQAAVNARLFPPPSAEAQRLSTMIASPSGSIAWRIAGLAGASPRTQDAILQSVAAAGQVAGSVTGMYKQTLTAQAPSPYGAARVRDAGNASSNSNSPIDGTAAAQAAATRSANTTRTGTVRTNAQDWRELRTHWDDLGYGEILSTANRAAISRGRTPKVDADWVKVFPEDAGLMGERIPMHHIGGLPVTIPLPDTRHLNAHMPGGFRYNPGGPGSAAPFYPPKP